MESQRAALLQPVVINFSPRLCPATIPRAQHPKIRRGFGGPLISLVKRIIFFSERKDAFRALNRVKEFACVKCGCSKRRIVTFTLPGIDAVERVIFALDTLDAWWTQHMHLDRSGGEAWHLQSVARPQIFRFRFFLAD